MSLRLITADERLKTGAHRNTVLVAGGFKIGKTTLARGFDPSSSLFVDFEAGDKSLQNWPGVKTSTIRTWNDALAIVCLIGGVDPAVDERRPGWQERPFSSAHYEWACKNYGDISTVLKNTETIFTDSFTKLSERCWEWGQQQPECYNKYGAFDPRSCYGLIGREMVRTLGHLHYSSARNIIYVGGLDQREDQSWQISMVGQMASREAPYIADTVVSYDLFDTSDGVNWFHNPQSGAVRAFCCHKQNPWKLPAGDRSGRLAMMEPPNLRALIDKMNAG